MKHFYGKIRERTFSEEIRCGKYCDDPTISNRGVLKGWMINIVGRRKRLEYDVSGKLWLIMIEVFDYKEVKKERDDFHYIKLITRLVF